MEDTSIKALLVEDNMEYAGLLRGFLADTPFPRFDLTHVEHLEKALQLLKERVFNIILLDLNLPDSRGLTTLDQIKAQAPGMPVVVLTGLDDRMLSLEAVRKGAQDYLVKGQIDARMLPRVMRYAIERKHIEEVLVEERYLLHSLLDYVPDNIYFKDLDSRFIRINKQMAELFGLNDPAKAVGKTDFDFFTKDHAKPAYEDEQRVIKSGRPLVNIEEKETWPDGRETWVSTTKVPLRDNHARIIGTFGVSRDITSRKQAEQQLKKTNEELARSEKALRETMQNLKTSHEELKHAQMQILQAEKMESVGRLAAGVAHEVKNPLAIIQMGIEYLSRSPLSGNENMPIVLKDMWNAIQRADSIVRGLVDFSASRELDLKVEDMNDVIDQSLLLVRHELLKSRVAMIKTLGINLPHVRLDKNRVQQVLVNTIMNATHAMPNGGMLTIRTYTRKLAEIDQDVGDRTGNRLRAGDYVLVTEIDDTGTGIPDDKISKIFDPFYTTKATGKGTGLGLTVSKKIIELHGGTIDIRNRRVGGVSVTIMFKTSGRQPV